MHVGITAHNAKNSTSSTILINYLEKENDYNNLNNQGEKLEYFFDNNYSVLNTEQKIIDITVINEIDNNRGSQKLKDSNFYMINVSPSFAELKHMENIAEIQLKNKGIEKSESEVLNKYFLEQKDLLMKVELKLYTKNVMNEYANNFNREIYCNEDKLPNDAEKKELNLKTEIVYNNFLKDNNIDLTKNESLKNESKEWVKVDNIIIKNDNGKSLLVEIDLKERGKADVNIPKSTLQLQKDNTYKMPKNLYEQKISEVINKNTLVEIDYKFKSTSIPDVKFKNNIAYNFEIKDPRFEEKLSISIREKDLTLKDNKYYVSKHLLDEKKYNALKNGVEKEFGKHKEKIYNSLAEAKGFDMSKRALTGDDLLWYGKVETERTYKHTDKFVKENEVILKQLKSLQSNENYSKKEYNKLKDTLHKHKESGKVITRGDKKEGLQYHTHVIVSRHDKTMKNPRNKISLSPLANAKESQMQNGSKVGFDRNVFTKKVEMVFDKQMEFQRDKNKSYEAYKNNRLESEVKGKAKQFIMKHTGLNEIKANISPVQSIKNEIGIAKIPTRFPKSITDLAIKVVKKVVEQAF